jgi:hypothetical protein
VKGLCQDNTVEAVRRDVIGSSQIRDDGGRRVPLRNVEDILVQDTVTPEPAHIAVVPHFQHVSVNVVSVTGKKGLYIVPIDGQATLKSELAADRSQAPQVSKANCASWRDIQVILPP